ncbi:hypothetical protein W97_05685 [Coniosporium apollinis CBS 100218]|uniref:Lysine-specific metallo-endopeptidase domain-containing protein n=1 Tax=Coniosporium apollinis (strain CBS 100218) TaxID=1168221 RepID=R7YWK9_CONA1|nr:uncharacterized protein W97_05685 [Coniosporium apollinis CBS 100218]EON66292.1 hypothetical protein W97_05685 [Coniosporium apollinis CBS 100218]
MPRPEDITEQQMKDAFPERDPANVTNWYGTSLYGWDGCDDINKLIKGWIKEAYTDANKLVNYDGVKSNINWDSAAALEYLGPSAYNKDQQKQIQAVFANVATVKEGISWWTPNWIRVRCDDPAGLCSKKCPTSQENKDPAVVLAYARNPVQAGEKYPDISFCPEFYGLRNLGNAIAYGSGFSNPNMKNDLSNYEGRANTFLHELMHLDLAADSVKESPNPHIRDLKIKFTYIKDGEIKTSGWTKAYGPSLAKILARFQPISISSPQTGYFVQRNVDNLVSFALANYVQNQIRSYPFLPIVYDIIKGGPMLPPKRESTDPFVIFAADGDKPVSFVNFTTADNGGARQLEDGGDCPTVLENDSGEDLEIGAPIPSDLYPKSYWDERNKWLEAIKGEDSSKTCKLAIREIWTCEPVESNLYASVKITDAYGDEIYASPQSTRTPGQPINDANPLSLQKNGMKNALVITGEHTNDYIQFAYGSTFWTSGTKDGIVHCTLRGDDWNKSGPPGCPAAPAISRDFDCEFPC